MSGNMKICSLAHKKAERLLLLELTKDIRAEKKLEENIARWAKRTVKKNQSVSLTGCNKDVFEHSVTEKTLEYKSKLDTTNSDWAPWSKNFKG